MIEIVFVIGLIGNIGVLVVRGVFNVGCNVFVIVWN